jgi:hypothetical protein
MQQSVNKDEIFFDNIQSFFIYLHSIQMPNSIYHIIPSSKIVHTISGTTITITIR